MAKILKFKPPDGTLKRLLQRSLEQAGAKLTAVSSAPKAKEINNDNVVPMFRQRRRRQRV